MNVKKGRVLTLLATALSCMVAVFSLVNVARSEPNDMASPMAMPTASPGAMVAPSPAVAAPSPAMAAPTPAAVTPAPVGTHRPVPRASQLVKVSACNPNLNVMQSGGYVAGPGYYGYAPGYYGRGGYWGDAYGARYYQAPVTTTDPQLGIDYVNISHKAMSSIEFGLVVNGVLRAEVRDVGTFSPGAEIKHKFGISPNVFPIQSGLPQCIPLRITFQDGTKWRNPGLPPKNQHIYMHP